MYCDMNVVMVFGFTQRKLECLMYTTPRLMNTKWINVKLLKHRQGVETMHLISLRMMHYVGV